MSIVGLNFAALGIVPKAIPVGRSHRPRSESPLFSAGSARQVRKISIGKLDFSLLDPSVRRQPLFKVSRTRLFSAASGFWGPPPPPQVTARANSVRSHQRANSTQRQSRLRARAATVQWCVLRANRSVRWGQIENPKVWVALVEQ